MQYIEQQLLHRRVKGLSSPIGDDCRDFIWKLFVEEQSRMDSQ